MTAFTIITKYLNDKGHRTQQHWPVGADQPVINILSKSHYTPYYIKSRVYIDNSQHITIANYTLPDEVTYHEIDLADPTSLEQLHNHLNQ